MPWQKISSSTAPGLPEAPTPERMEETLDSRAPCLRRKMKFDLEGENRQQTLSDSLTK